MASFSSFMFRGATKYYLKLMCGICERPASIHKNHADFPFREFCNREFYDWTVVTYGEFPDYYLDGTAAVDYSGSPAKIEALCEDWTLDNETLWSETDEWDKQLDSILHWRDINPEEHTSAIDWWYINTKGQARMKPNSHISGTYTPEHKQYHATSLDFTKDRTIHIEGVDGFYSTMLIDPIITEKYQNHLLNIFRSKTGSLRVGSVEVTTVDLHNDGTKWVHARCVNNECPSDNYIALPLDDTVTREYQENFVWAIVTHGNNHAAAWFRNRPEFYELHYELRDKELDEPENYVNALMDHNSKCTNPECNCVNLLGEQVPALLEMSTAA